MGSTWVSTLAPQRFWGAGREGCRDRSPVPGRQAGRAGSGAELLSRFGRLAANAVSQKGHADYVTEADTAAEVAILKVLNEAAAGYGFLGEETGYHAGDKTETWVVDPLDGTSNFVWGIPYFAVSIALCDESGEVLGVVFDPIRDEMFSAVRGRGAWLNDVRVPALAAKPPESAMVSISMPVPRQLRCITKGQFLTGLQNNYGKSCGRPSTWLGRSRPCLCGERPSRWLF
jgi:myo-inositol-1(or 4)-monophosphatase